VNIDEEKTAKALVKGAKIMATHGYICSR